MNIMPIPAELLTDSFTLLIPNSSGGYSRTPIYDVRVVRTNRISDYVSSRVRDSTELTIYFDCENSYPQDVRFSAGQSAEYRGERFELTEVKAFGAEDIHHYKMTAVKTGGKYSG